MTLKKVHFFSFLGDLWENGLKAPEKINTETRNVQEVNESEAANNLEMDLMNMDGKQENILIPNKMSDSIDSKVPEPVVESQNLIPSKAHRVPKIVKTGSVGEVPNEGGGYNLQPVEEYSEGRVPTENAGSETGQVPPEEETGVLQEFQKLENIVDKNLKM